MTSRADNIDTEVAHVEYEHKRRASIGAATLSTSPKPTERKKSRKPTSLKATERDASPEPKVSNYDMIGKLVAALLEFIEEQGIEVAGLDELLASIKGMSDGEKLAFLKAHFVPRVNGLRNLVVDQAKKADVELSGPQLDRIEALLKAMCEVAEA